jgi:hypothetical protein
MKFTKIPDTRDRYHLPNRENHAIRLCANSSPLEPRVLAGRAWPQPIRGGKHADVQVERIPSKLVSSLVNLVVPGERHRASGHAEPNAIRSSIFNVAQTDLRIFQDGNKPTLRLKKSNF